MPRTRAEERAGALARGLYPHQVEGLTFLLGRKGAILADDMGLGKTRQAVLALSTAAPAGPYLVVAPASVKRNWAREIELAQSGGALPERGRDDLVHVLGAAPPPGFTGWVIVHYELLERHLEALLALQPAGVVFDEAHYLKNHASRRSRLARRLVDHHAARPLVYLLTGTPLTSRPRDLFPLLQLIRHPLGRNFLAFARRYCAAWHNGFGWVTDGASHTDELALELQGVLIRRTKDQVLDLPPKVRTFLEVDVPPGTAERDTLALLDGLRGPGPRSGTARTRLMATLTRARHALARAKVEATLDLVASAVEQGEKVLVFSCFDEPLQRIHRHFGARSLLLTGRTPAAQRQALVDRFQQDPEVAVLAANLQTGGLGLNLTAARQVVFNDLDWVPASHWQAEDRAYRIGQTASVHVAYLVARGTLDGFVGALLQSKARLVERVVDGAPEGPATANVLTELESLVRDLVPATETPDREDASGTPGVLERAARAVRERVPDAARAAVRPSPVSTQLIERLARVLSGPSIQRYRVRSAKDPARTYVLESDGSSVTCSCSGFEYRGTCSHARGLKQALGEGGALPAGYHALDRA